MGFLIANNEIADKYLEIALNANELEHFLGGTGPYKIVVGDQYGSPVFSARHVMEAIYRKYAKDKSIYDKMNEAFLNIIKNKKLESQLLNVLEDFEYQLYCEKNNLAPFKMDFKTLAAETKKRIYSNKERYTTENGYGPKGVWPKLEQHNQKMSDYDYEIL